jgi:hypothetical protein
MSHFTTEEANACTITRAEKVSKDGIHLYWVFGINDADGNYHDWKDTELAEDADDTTQKTSIHTHLINKCTKKPAKPVIIVNTSDSIIGQTIG